MTMFSNCLESLYKNRNQILTKWGKDQTGNIEYHINSQGFRSRHDYDSAPSYAFFGSSSLFGIGVSEDKILTSKFENSHNYGLAGEYLNIDSVINLKSFINSNNYNPSVNIVFFWIERDGIEVIPELYKQVDELQHTNMLHISQGRKYNGIINLTPSIDFDISGTHPGPKTHHIWAKTIKSLFKKINAKTTNSH